jgi:polyisoprenoid-binding protein YceI
MGPSIVARRRTGSSHVQQAGAGEEHGEEQRDPPPSLHVVGLYGAHAAPVNRRRRDRHGFPQRLPERGPAPLPPPANLCLVALPMTTSGGTMNARIFVWTVLATLGLGSAGFADTFAVDPAHTSVQFQVRHIFTKVTGRFQMFDGKIVYDEKNPARSEVQGSIDAASINTNVEKRDNHLRSADFFDVEKFPKITFQSTGVSDVDASGKNGKMTGTLTLHGVTRPVVLEASFLGKGKGPDGKERAGFHGTTTINRKDFGLTWNKALESGGVLVGDDVTIDLDVEGVQQG